MTDEEQAEAQALFDKLEKLAGQKAADSARRQYAENDFEALRGVLLRDIADWERAKKPQPHERIWNYNELRREWVFVVGLNRFIQREPPIVAETIADLAESEPFMLPKHVFDDAFAYTCKLPRAVSYYLFREKGKHALPRCRRTVYRPGQPEFVGQNFNLYKPSDVVPAPGDTTLWNEHLNYLFDPTDRDHVLNWCAWFLQNLEEKPKHALLVAGRIQGTGKSFIAEGLARILGMHNVSPITSAELSSTFNKWAIGAKLLVVEELRALDKREVKMRLHPMITQELIPINDKGIPTFKTANCFGLFIMSNEDAAIALDNSDRRYLVVRTHAKPRDKDYYDRLYELLHDQDALAAIAYELMHHDLKGYSGQARAPETKAKEDMIDAGADAWAKWMREHADNAPLCYDVLDPDEIRDHSGMPKALQNRFGVDDAIRNALKGKTVARGTVKIANPE